MKLLDRLRPDLQAFAGYSSARREAQGGQVFLNANESPWPPFDDDALGLNRYPEPQPTVLTEALAALYGVPPQRLLVGRGSDEAIDLLVRGFCRAGEDAVADTPPVFGMYAVSAALQGARLSRVPLIGADFEVDFAALAALAEDPTVKLLFLCSPNNPIGVALPSEAVLALCEQLKDRVLVVVDEAYGEFQAGPSLVTKAGEVENLAVLRTLSKAHALAGARIGALIAQPLLVAFLKRLMAPYPLPKPSVQAALRALTARAQARTRERVAATISERQRLSLALGHCAGIERVWPSEANFLLFRAHDANRLYQGLLAEGVLIRDVGRQPGLTGCLRVSIGTPEENDRFLLALRALAPET